MKFFLHIVVLLAASISTAWSQTCSVASFQTQAEIDNFSATYPGCKVINSDVSIISTTITNLDGLRDVTGINGSVYINNNQGLTSIAGLSGLAQVDGEINIEGNDNLLTLNGLENFVRPMGNVRVVDNENLTSISALSGLTRIPGFLSVGSNPSLTTLAGLENLTRVDGAISIGDNAHLADMKGIGNLAYVGGFFYLAKNNSLTDFQGLEKLSHVGERLEITTNSALTSLLGLGNLDIAFNIIITNNPLLTNCAIQDVCQLIEAEKIAVSGNAAGCSNIQEVSTSAGCSVENCYAVTLQTQADVDNFPTANPGCKVINGNVSIISTTINNLDGLNNVTRIEGSLYINDNPGLASIAGLSGLAQVDGSINIENNDNLLSLAGLENLVRPLQNVRIVFNERLASISALTGLTRIYGYLSIGGNPSLTSLTGLENLNRVWKQVSIGDNTNLSDLKGIHKLGYIGDYFYLARNASLTNLQGLENLGYVGARFEITGNSTLNSITELKQLGYTSFMFVTNNPLLSNCAVQAVCSQIAAGRAEISGNASGCSSIEEIRTAAVCNLQSMALVRLNAGGGNFTATNGNVFNEDRYYSGIGRINAISGGDILGTDNDELYRSERSSESFDYAIPMVNGEYMLTLHFAEIYFGGPGGLPGGAGKRMFNIDIEGVRQFENFDVFARAGGAMRAHTEQVPVTVTDGILDLNFSRGAANQPTLAGIEVVPVSDEEQTTAVAVQIDAHVEDGNAAGQNFATSALLGVKDVSGGPNRRAYLRFPIEGAVGGGVLSAKLRLYGYNQQANDGVLILGVGVDDDSWTENGITWNNAPAYRPTTLKGRVQVNSTLKYWEMDVTEFVTEQSTGDKVVSLALFESSNRNRSVLFHSRENPSGRAPELIITSRGSSDNNPGVRTGLKEKETAMSSIPGEGKSTIFPNPASGHFTIRLSESHQGNVSMKLIGQQGKRYELGLPGQKNVRGEQEIDLSKVNPATGIYLLKVESDSKTEVVKVLIDK
ncbi:CBM96 family carbohydrate-binding protein [Dyadobacter bucti]|uniref:CBM96 family carbohydrate-binding protein n=1 Tax=Dyadobacter bucti TaxID=2572203 RepID=UPI001108DF0E|nr:malectin domain-containing carbohydrate-binding protein [Dyadobacter bucti]